MTTQDRPLLLTVKRSTAYIEVVRIVAMKEAYGIPPDNTFYDWCSALLMRYTI